MGFVISVLYFVTYYLTPTTVFGPLAAFRIELILAVLVLLASLPKLSGCVTLKAPQTVALIGLAIATFLSMLVALHWAVGALNAFLAFIPNAFAFFLTCLHFNSKKRLQVVILMLLFVCLFVIARGYGELMFNPPDVNSPNSDSVKDSYLIAQGSDISDMIYRLRGLGEINDPNDFGQIQVCLIPLVFIFWQPRKTLRNLLYVLLPVGVLLFGTYLTHSRGALLALLAIAVLAARRRIGALPAILLAIGMFAGAMSLHFTGGREISAEAGADRTELWGEGLQILKFHPVFGVGPGEFAGNCGGCGHTAHNSLVLCAAELGSFGLFFWCLFLFPTVRDALILASPEKVSESDLLAFDEERSTLWNGKPEVIDKAEINRLGRLLLLSLTGFFVTGWFLSRAFVLTLFLLGGMVEVVYGMALERGMIPPRMTLFRVAPKSAGLAIGLILLMYIMLRTVNLMH